MNELYSQYIKKSFFILKMTEERYKNKYIKYVFYVFKCIFNNKFHDKILKKYFSFRIKSIKL